MKYEYKNYIASIQDFPKEGILFRDITPLLANGDVFRSCVDDFSSYAREVQAEVILSPESRGFIFGCPVATNLKLGFVPVRKPNKLPRETIEASYELEYGKNTLCIHKDAIKKGQKVLIIDDLLATGGTTQAAIKLVEELGGIVVGIAFLIELKDLKGRELLNKYSVHSLITY